MSGRQQDSYGRRARKEGYPARSVYKLEEIDRRLGLLRRGYRVLDLGAYPGSWTLYSAERVAPSGSVVAVDLQGFDTELPARVTAYERDVLTVADEAATWGPFDLVLSDMAPSTTGRRDLDQYRSFELFMAALRIAEASLKEGGAFVGKIFQGQEFSEAKIRVAQLFEKTRIVRPKATRSESYELFIAGLGRKKV